MRAEISGGCVTVQISKIVGVSEEEVINRSLISFIDRLRMRGGEAEVFRLYKSGEFDAISSDDGKFLKILDALHSILDAFRSHRSSF